MRVFSKPFGDYAFLASAVIGERFGVHNVFKIGKMLSKF